MGYFKFQYIDKEKKMELEQPLLNDSPQQKQTYRQKCVHFALGIVTTLFCLLPTTSMAEENMCTDLKKVNNLDELLYQMYINLDSDCLFTMPLADLEKAWGIQILSKERLQPGQTIYEMGEAYADLRNSDDFRGKPYRSEADAFYVDARRENNRTKQFQILITKVYLQEHATLFPEGNFPKLIPEPTYYGFNPAPISYPPLRVGDPPQNAPEPKNPGVYTRDYLCYWLNADRTHMIYIFTETTPSVTRITVNDEIPRDLKKIIQ